MVYLFLVTAVCVLNESLRTFWAGIVIDRKFGSRRISCHDWGKQGILMSTELLLTLNPVKLCGMPENLQLCFEYVKLDHREINLVRLQESESFCTPSKLWPHVSFGDVPCYKALLASC